MLRTFALILLTISVVTSPATAQDADNTSGAPFPDLPTFTTDDPGAYGQQLAEHMDLYDQGWVDSVTQGRMTLFDADGQSIERAISQMIYERVDAGNKLITRFLSPAEIKGVAALTHESPGATDDNWLYLPANKRVRRISGANNTASFQGTEFTFEDLGSLDPREYDWTFVESADLERDGTRVPVYVLDAIPTYEDTGYSRLRVHVHRDHWRQERTEYFDKAERPLKVLDSTDWQLFHGRFWRANDLDMRNLQTGKRTHLVQQRIFLNLGLYTSAKTGKPRKGLTEEIFTTRALGQ